MFSMGAALLLCRPAPAADSRPCEILTVGAISDLIAGATTQQIGLTATCKLSRGNYSLRWHGVERGSGSVSDDGATSLLMTLTSLPPDLPRGEQTFQLLHLDSGTKVADPVLRIGEITVSRGTVSYRDSGAQRHRGQELAADSRLPIAVVNPPYGVLAKRAKERSNKVPRAQVEATSARISNRAFLALPPSLASLPGEWSWAVHGVEPIELLDGDGPAASNALENLSPKALAHGISYVVGGEQTTRLHATLTLRRDKVVWLEAQVALAESARSGLGQPLPISEMLYVACRAGSEVQPSDVAFNGATRAIRDGSLSEGRCSLYVDPCNLRPLLHDKAPPPPRDEAAAARKAAELKAAAEKRTGEVVEKYSLFGAQSLVVSVERAGVSGRWEGRWIIEPSKWLCEARKEPGKEDGYQWPSFLLKYLPVEDLPLSIPAGDPGDGDAVYTIQVRGAAWTPSVQYSAGTTPPPENAGTPLLAPDYQFTARLRPPGPFGFGYYRGPHGQRAHSVRMFVTIPVEGVAFRFPPSMRDLRSTSDNTAVEVLSLRAGVLLTVEPWDYNRGKNPLWVPLRLQGGMHLVDLGRGAFAPSTLLGISAALPLLGGAPKFAQTSVGIGLFWENDLRDRSNHFLLTIGLNLLSLFSPAAGPGK